VSIIEIAAAPASFGVVGPPGDGKVVPVSPLALPQAVTAAGYVGTELPPSGAFGTPAQLVGALSANGLRAAGAYVPLELGGDEERYRASLRALQRTVAEQRAAGPRTSRRPRRSIGCSAPWPSGSASIPRTSPWPALTCRP
jgi:sugar phosphate isomerase/epimerase